MHYIGCIELVENCDLSDKLCLWQKCMSMMNLPISCYWDILLCVSIPVKILACGTVVVILQEQSKSERNTFIRQLLFQMIGKKALTKM